MPTGAVEECALECRAGLGPDGPRPGCRRAGAHLPAPGFAGLSVEETAEALGISPATVKRDWATGKLWLYNELRTDEDAG
jgi:hypothetical protein